MTNSDKASQPAHELRRDVSIWGSYMWGFADVGANVFVALGLVIASAQGGASLAFALAGLAYILIGLAYTELASAYPVAGGGQYFACRGLGDFWGFVAGSALLLDFTIDIALFAVASAGYLNFFFPVVKTFTITLGPIKNFQWFWCLETFILISFLIWINIKGVKESSRLNEILGIFDIALECSLVVLGLVLAWKPELFLDQWRNQFPSLHNFMYGSSLAIISFVGLESISQAAQETRRPATIIPRTSIALIFTVFIFSTAFSVTALGILPWQEYARHVDNPVAQMASAIPYFGIIGGYLTAFLGFTILLISANTGVMGASRVTFCMSQFNLLSDWFSKVHPKYHTPVRTIVFFSLVGILQAVLSFLTPNALDTLGNMYAFGATLGYTLVFISLIRLRFIDPHTPRPYKMPFNLKIKYKGGIVELPVLGILGILGVSSILFMVILTHSIGRIAGPAWVLLCLFYYLWYRKKQGQPLFKSTKKDWETEQKEILASAEEFDLLERYKMRLAERDKQLKKRISQYEANGNGK